MPKKSNYRIDFSRLPRTEDEVLDNVDAEKLTNEFIKKVGKPRAVSMFEKYLKSLPEGHVLDSEFVKDNEGMIGSELFKKHVLSKYPEAFLTGWDSYNEITWD